MSKLTQNQSLKLYKPTTPSRRHSSVVNYKEILTTNEPHKKLIIRKKTNAGRNNQGKITVRHRGGGSRKLIRQIDFKRNFPQGFKVLTVEYDPGRSAFICLVTNIADGEKKYVLHTTGMEVGKIYNQNSEITSGNSLPLSEVPLSSEVSQIELKPNQGAKIVRSAGNYAIVTAKEEKFVTLKLPSGEIRKILASCKAVVGRISNEAHGLERIGSAGRVRRTGRRPQVRGKVMNPVDHPHGGGEGRNSIGLKYPKTPQGKHALGVRTRDKKKASQKVIVQRRAKKRK
jgi:large subunit ribosomal protein L2